MSSRPLRRQRCWSDEGLTLPQQHRQGLCICRGLGSGGHRGHGGCSIIIQHCFARIVRLDGGATLAAARDSSAGTWGESSGRGAGSGHGLQLYGFRCCCPTSAPQVYPHPQNSCPYQQHDAPQGPQSGCQTLLRL